MNTLHPRYNEPRYYELPLITNRGFGSQIFHLTYISAVLLIDGTRHWLQHNHPRKPIKPADQAFHLLDWTNWHFCVAN